MLNWALRYLKNGYSVIPLVENSKSPIINWREFQKRKATEEEIRKWWNTAPNANIGIITGKISNLVVIDVDGQAALQKASLMGLTSSITSLTGSGGKHLWYRYPQEGIESKRLWKGENDHEEIFLRSDDLYVVAPPSVHPNGKRYRWLKPLNMYVPSLPNIFMPKIVEQISTKLDDWEPNQRLDIAKAIEDIKNGHVHNTLVSVLGKFRHVNFSEEDTYACLQDAIKKGGMDSDEFKAKINEIWRRYEPGRAMANMPESSTTLSSRVYGMQSNTKLTIYSPTNPESWREFNTKTTTIGQRIKTGYTKFDEMLKEGLKSARPFTIAALSGHGKTNFGISLAKNLCQQNLKVLYFSTEYTYNIIWKRYMATLQNPKEFRNHQFYVPDLFRPTLEQIEETIIQVKPEIVVFDHIQHIGKEKEVLTQYMQAFQLFQRKYDLQMIVLAQLNRNADWVENGKRVIPRMSMIEGSSTIEQASSRVLLLSVQKDLPEYKEIVGVLDKNDNGDTGIINFGLYKQPYHIEEL